MQISNSPIDLFQRDLPAHSLVCAALQELADSGIEERGAIFTRREVVDFMLDLAGYTANRPLFDMSLLEPSFGEGDFLIPAIERLIASVLHHYRGISLDSLSAVLCNSIQAVELHHESFTTSYSKIVTCLQESGFSLQVSTFLADSWLIEGDYLLVDTADSFDFVIGNPPYVRQERIPDILIQSYRSIYSTIYDRADLYVPFIEKSLSILKKGGVLSFICSDRWMKNRYGARLREFVSKNYHLKCYIDMVNVPAFNVEVIAYPAITVISRDQGQTTRIAHRPDITKSALDKLCHSLLAPTLVNATVTEISGLVQGEEPWILETSDQIDLVRRLEADYPLIEDAGCRVGIGVATGADKVFIAPFDTLDVEADRKLPLVTTKDIRSGQVHWQGLGVINPFSDDGRLVNLDDYPKLKAYLHSHEEIIRKRNVAKRRPDGWYRTIDRIYPELVRQSKLLIPDIKGSAHVVYEAGQFYPHHNLYFITSDTWDIRALQAVLMSGIARLFVATYSTVMHGGFLRFQAQYLRRIRLPYWHDVPEEVQDALIKAVEKKDQLECNEAVSRLYNLTQEERAAISADG